MLPFDNKSEFQIILNMPEGSSLERTAQVAREMAAAVRDGAGGDRLSDLRRHGRAVQLQRPGAALLPAPRRERRRHPGQPGAEARARRRRATTSRKRIRPRSPRSRRDTARASPWPKCRPARRCCRRWSPKSTGRTTRRASAWREGCATSSSSTPGVVDIDWYVEVAAAQGALRRRQGEGRPARHQRRRPSPRRCDRGGRSSPSVCCTSRASRRTWTSCSTCPATPRTHGRRDLLALRAARRRGRSLARSAAASSSASSTRRGPEHLSQEPDARDLRDRRRGGGRREPGLRDLRR